MRIEIDFIALEEQYGLKIAKRKADYEKALQQYTDSLNQSMPDSAVTFSAEVAEEMAYLAYHYNHYCTKPFVKGLCDRYKIASITEFVVCFCQPLTCRTSGADEQLLNAQFAVYCALNIIDNFREEEDDIHFSPENNASRFECALVELQDRMDRLLENHTRYLANLADTKEGFPFISNAFMLEAIHTVYQYRWQALMI